jgi:hypothetical protein
MPEVPLKRRMGLRGSFCKDEFATQAALVCRVSRYPRASPLDLSFVCLRSHPGASTNKPFVSTVSSSNSSRKNVRRIILPKRFRETQSNAIAFD